MVEILSILLSLTFVLGQRNKFDFGLCASGYILINKCVEKCPDSHVEFENYCYASFKPIFSLISESNLKEETGKTELLKFKESSLKSPIFTTKYGLFFTELDSIEISRIKKSKNFQILSFYLSIFKEGSLISDNQGLSKFYIEDGFLKFKFIKSEYLLIVPGSTSSTWIKIEIIFEQKDLILTELTINITNGLSHVEKLSIVQDLSNITSWVIGKYSEKSFVGFLKNFVYFIDPVHIQDHQEEECFSSEENLKLCKDTECIETLCLHNSRKLACLDPPECLAVTSTCPNFYTEDSNNKCVIDVGDIGFYYCFDTPESTVTSIAGSASVLEPDSCNKILYSPGRGKYFNGYNSKYKTQNQDYYNLEPTYMAWIKIDSDSSGIWSKDGLFSIYTSKSSIKFNLHSDEKEFREFNRKEWFFLELVLIFHSTTLTDFKAFIDNKEVMVSSFTTTYHYDAPSTAYFGFANNFYLLGWIYFIAYTPTNHKVSLGSFIDQPKCKYWTLLDGNCLIECDLFFYSNSNTCQSCLANCNSCQSKECNSCHDIQCNDCSRNSPGKCTSCKTSYLTKGYCYATCPFMYSANGKSCIPISGTFKLSFHSESEISSSPNLMNFVQNGALGIFYQDLGAYFNAGTDYESTAKFYIGPEYSMAVWLKMQKGSDFRIGFNSDGLYFNLTHIKIVPFSEVVYIALQNNVSDWNLYVIKCFSFISYNSSIGPYHYDIFYNVPMLYNIYVNKDLLHSLNYEDKTTQASRVLSNFKISTGLDSSMNVYLFGYSTSFFNSNLFLTSMACSSASCMNCGLAQYINSDFLSECKNFCETCGIDSFCLKYSQCCKHLLQNCFNSCPLLFADVEDTCIKDPNVWMRFRFDSLKGKISDGRSPSIMSLTTNTQGTYPNIDLAVDPVPGLQKGFYFGKDNNEIFMQSSIKFQVSSAFFIGVWLRPEAYSEFIYKNSMFFAGLTTQGPKVIFFNKTSDEYSALSENQLPKNSWSFIGISIDYSNSLTTADIYTNSLKFSKVLSLKIIQDNEDFLYVGKGKNSNFIGWIYEVVYSAEYLDSSIVLLEIGSCSGCSCPSSLNACLHPCGLTDFYAFGVCNSCNEVPYCISSIKSTLCFDSRCASCEDYKNCLNCPNNNCSKTCSLPCSTCMGPSVYECIECNKNYKQYGLVCVPECPLLYGFGSPSVCISTTTSSISVKFNTLAYPVRSSDNLLSFNYSSGTPTVAPARGWFFSSLSCNNKTALGIDSALSFWIQPLSVGTIFNKHSSLQQELQITISSQNSILLKFQGMQKTYSLVFNTETSLVGTWQSFVFAFSHSKGVYKVKMIFQGTKEFESSVNFDYLSTNSSNSIKIGALQQKWWIFSFEYFKTSSELIIGNLFGNCLKTCACPSPDNICLSECKVNERDDGESCSLCNSSCVTCRYNDTCSLCPDRLCKSCTDLNNEICSDCIPNSSLNKSSNLCSCDSGYYQNGSFCFECVQRCVECVTLVYKCKECKTGYIKSSEGICMNYCSEGENSTNGSCISSNSTIFDFKFTKNTNSYKFNQIVLYLGENDNINPKDDSLQPWLLYQRGLFFNKSQITLGSFSTPTSLRLSNRHSFSIYFNILACCGSILNLGDNFTSFISLKSEYKGNSPVMNLTYSISDFYHNETMSHSFNISFLKWVFLSWSLSFDSPDLKLRLFLNQEFFEVKSKENRVFNQPLSSGFYIGKYSLSFMIGYIYQLSLFSFTIDQSTLSLNPNLINCRSHQYLYNSQCLECNSSCSFGCFDNRSCKVHPDLLCSYFEDIEESCKTCVKLTLDERPCKCEKNSKYWLLSDSCKCDSYYYEVDKKCQICPRWLQRSDIEVYFTKSFVEIRVDFNVSIVNVDCREIIQASFLDKFGSEWSCEMSEDQNSVLYTLGEGFSISNEPITFISENLKGIEPECGYSRVDLTLQIYFSVEIPRPTALIKAVQVVYYSCENLTIDGSLSFGSFRDKLDFKWEFYGIPELSKYSTGFGDTAVFSFESSELMVGVLRVVLTVKNKYELTDSAEIFITLTDIQGVFPVFDTSVTYSCAVSKTCQFLISKISTCIKNPELLFIWELVEGENLLTDNELKVFWGSQIPGDAIIIPKNTFPPSRVTFLVTIVENKSQVSGNGTLIVMIEPEPPVIIIENALGVISTLKDLSVNASRSFDPSGGELRYKWECLGICNFSYASNESILTIGKDILKNQLFDAFLLNVSSTVSIEGENEKIVTTSQAVFTGAFVNKVVPKVSIIETFEKTQPKRFPRSKDSSLTAIVEESDEEFNTSWILRVNEKNLIKSGENNPAVVIDMSLTVPGYSYKVLFRMQDKLNSYFDFFYEFSANQAPKLGYCSISPSEGLELKTTFTYKSVEWVDEEEDYPLAYSFGYIVDTRQSFLSEKSEQNTFSTKFIYLGEFVQVFCQIFDSLGDSVEAVENITVSIDPEFSTSDLLKETTATLNTSLLKTYPSLVENLIHGILNRDSTTGNYSSISSADLQTAFDVCTQYLSIYSSTIFPSSYATNQMISLLDSLTNNSEVSSSNNSIITNQLITGSLTRSNSAQVPLSSSQGSAFLYTLDKTANLTTSLNQTQLMSSIPSAIDQISKGVILGMVENQKLTLKSAQTIVDVVSSKSNSMNNATLSSSASEIASITLPSTISDDIPDNVGISISFLNIENDGNNSSGVVIGLSLFTHDQVDPLTVNLKDSFFTIMIPGKNLANSKNLTCIFLDTDNHKWSSKGCKLVSSNEDSVVCQCNHLTFFSTGDSSNNFSPNSNIDQTVDVNALKDINSSNAIGFYFSLGIIAIYVILLVYMIKKDRNDWSQQYELINKKYYSADRSDNEIKGNLESAIDVTTKEANEVIPNQSSARKRYNDTVLFELETNKEPVQIKTKSRLFLENHEFFSLFYFNNPYRSRSLRCTLIFTVFIGNMYFIGLFYDGEKRKNSGILDSFRDYSFRDLMVMIYSSIIMNILVVIMPAFIKGKPLDFELTKSDNFKILKRNKIINIALISVYCVVMAYFCWSISLIALHLQTGTSYMWVCNTIISILVKFFILSVMILIIKIFIVSRIIAWIKKMKKEKEQKHIEQFDPD